MKCFALTSSYRTLSNYKPVLDAMAARGDQVEFIWLEAARGLPGQAPRDFGLRPVAERIDVSYTPPAATNPFWTLLERAFEQHQPELLFCDDMAHWPAIRVAGFTRERRPRTLVIACQHGVYQPWNGLNESFAADFFFCFGRRHVLNFDERHWPRVFPVGLPKLDPLPSMEPGEGDHILFFAQSAPQAHIVRPLLLDLREKTGLPVKVRPHPGHPAAYDALQDDFPLLSPLDDPIDQIRSSKLLLTTHSTALLEALFLGKDCVLLPSFGLTDFTFYPGIATDFSADKVLAALKKVQREPAGVERFLTQVCGGRQQRATARALAMVDALIEQRRSGRALGRWWQEDGPVRALMAGEHPLCCLP